MNPTGPYGWDGENKGNPYFGIGKEYNCFHVFVGSNGKNQHDIPLTNDNDNATKLQQAVATAQTNYNTAKINADKASQQLTTDTQTLKSAQEKLAQVQADKVVDSPEVTQLKNQLQQLEASYHAKLDSINNHYKQTEQQLLDQYNQQLVNIANEPTSVDKLKESLDQKLTDIKNKHDAKLNQLAKDYQAKLDNIKENANQQLNNLKQQLAANHTKENQSLIDRIANLQQQLSNKKAELDQNLANLKAKDEDDYNVLEQKLKNSFSEAAKGHNDHYNTGERYEVVLAGSDSKQPSSSASTSENSTSSSASSAADDAIKVSSPVNNAVQVAVSAPAATTSMTREEVKKQNEAKLPQTGNENSIVAMALGTMLAMFGLGVTTKKRY